MEPKSMLTAVLLSLCLLSSNGRPSYPAGSSNNQNLTDGHYSSSSSTTTTTTAITSRSYDIHFHRGYSVVLNSYPLGDDGVTCQHRVQPSTAGKGYSMTNQSSGSLAVPVTSFSQDQSTTSGLPSNGVSSSSNGILTNQMQAQNGMATPYIPSGSQATTMMPGTLLPGIASSSAGGSLTSQTNKGMSSSYGGQSQSQGSYPSTLQSQTGVRSNSYGASNGQANALPAGQDLSQSQPYPYSGSGQSYSASSPQSYIVSGYASNANNGSYNYPNGVDGMPYGLGAPSVSTPYSSTYNNPSNSTYSYSAASSACVNLSPVDCQVQCYSSDYQSPNKRDCQHIVRTLSKPGLGSASILPDSRLYVSYRNCMIIFDNPKTQNPVATLDWNKMSLFAGRVLNQCAVNSYNNPEGGSCVYGTQQTSTGYSSGRGRTPGVVQNSGMLISVQARQDASGDFGDVNSGSMSY